MSDPAAAPAPTSAPPAAPAASAREFRALVVVVLVLGVLATLTARTFLAPVIIAAWFAGLTEPLVARVERRLGGRRRVAAIATVLLVLIIVVPVVLLALPLAGMVRRAIDALVNAPPGGVARRVIDSIAGGMRPGAAGSVASGAAQGTIARVVELGRSVVPTAAGLVGQTFGLLSTIVTQVFVLAVSAYYFAADRAAITARLRAGSPLAPAHYARLSREFMDVARAMLVGELLTAAAQGVVAGVVYAVLAVPHALFLAVLTGFLSLIPTLGSALVWVPICGVLVAAGRVRDAAILFGCGVLVIGTVDNVLRPVFARWGANKMHPLLLFIGIFGGLEVFGGWGLILGPLILALFVAAYRLYADEAEARRRHRAALLAADGRTPLRSGEDAGREDA